MIRHALAPASSSNAPQNGPKPSTRTRRRPLQDISNNAAVAELRKPTSTGSGPPLLAIEVLPPPTIAITDENRNYMQRQATDIDERENRDPNCATEIINDMFHRFRIVEQEQAIDPDYIARQPQLNSNMRRILVDWLTQLHFKFKMVPETLYLAINYLDRYLQVAKDVRRSKLQLVGVSCMFIAAKYEEIYPPSIDQFLITDPSFSKREVINMEYAICGALGFQLTVPTAHSFLCRALKAANVDSLAMVQLCSYITERSLQEYKMLKYPPSIIAAASVSIARKSSNRYPWSPTLLKYVGYDESDIADCIAEMQKYLKSPPSATDQQIVYKKYSTSRYGNVAQTPLLF